MGRCEEARQAAPCPAANLKVESWREDHAQNRPCTAELASLDIVKMHRLLDVVCDAIVEGQRATSSATASTNAGAEDALDAGSVSAGPFGPCSFMADWAFAVLAFVEEPLVDDVQFQLQRLRRACQKSIVSSRAAAEAGTREFDVIAHAQCS